MVVGNMVTETSEAGMPRSSVQGCTYAFSGTIFPATIVIMIDFKLSHYQIPVPLYSKARYDKVCAPEGR
jgi:hypothetical protein